MALLLINLDIHSLILRVFSLHLLLENQCRTYAVCDTWLQYSLLRLQLHESNRYFLELSSLQGRILMITKLYCLMQAACIC